MAIRVSSPVQASEPANTATNRLKHRHFISRLLFTLFCLEVGLVLFLLPWTHLWDNNYLFNVTPKLKNLWLSAYLRGAVSGVGLINLWIGLDEAWRLRRSPVRSNTDTA